MTFEDTSVESFMVFSNLNVFFEIATDSLHEAEVALNMNRQPKDNGGYILTYDQQRKSFKSSLISIAFSGAYLDLHVRLVYVNRNKKSPPRDWDRSINEEKLKTLGIDDSKILTTCKRLRLARNDVLHEKPLVKGESSTVTGSAQDIAKQWFSLIEEIRTLLPLE